MSSDVDQAKILDWSMWCEESDEKIILTAWVFKKFLEIKQKYQQLPNKIAKYLKKDYEIIRLIEKQRYYDINSHYALEQIKNNKFRYKKVLCTNDNCISLEVCRYAHSKGEQEFIEKLVNYYYTN